MKIQLYCPIPPDGIPIINAEFGNEIGRLFPDGNVSAPAHVKYLLFHGAAALEIESGKAVLKKSTK